MFFVYSFRTYLPKTAMHARSDCMHPVTCTVDAGTFPLQDPGIPM